MTDRETTDVPSFGWRDIVQRSSESTATIEPRVAELLSYLDPAVTHCRRILALSNAHRDESAQKALAVSMLIQAFRATTATAQLSLNGYADIAAGLARSVWELQLRLTRIRDGGELVALAELYGAVTNEIKLRDTSDADETDREVLETWINGSREIVEKAQALGADEKKLREIAQERISAVASRLGLSEEYNVWFRALSQMHHGARAFSTYHKIINFVPGGSSILLPVDHDAEVMLSVAIEHLYRCMTQAAFIFDEVFLAREIDQEHHALGRAIDAALSR